MTMLFFAPKQVLLIGAAVLVLSLGLVANSHAQSAGLANGGGGGRNSEGGVRTMSFTPRVSATVTATDNVDLTSDSKRSDVYTQLSPGFRAVSNGGRVRGSVDYSLNGFVYADSSSKNQVQHALNATLVTEAIDNWAFVDMDARVSQQSISAFGTQSSDPALRNTNQTQVSTFSVSPYFKGRLFGSTGYEARFRWGANRTGTSAASDSTSQTALFRLGGATGLSALSWSSEATHQVDDFDTGRTTTSDRLNGRLSYSLTPQLITSLLGGYESNNLATIEKRSGATYGFGVDWRPTERTKLSGQREHRLFGNAYSLSFEHRTPRSVWHYSNGRDVTTGLSSSTGSVLSAYDLYYAQFASLEPDPVKREALVNSFLLANGISPTSTVGGGFLTSALTLQRREELSFGLLGVRSSVTLLATRTDSRSLGGAAAASSDLTAFGAVKQTALSLNFSHRLTPISSVSLVLSEQKTTGSTTGQSNTLRLINVNWSSRLGQQTAVSLGARHAVSDSQTAPYDETAVTGFVSVQF